MSPDSEADSGRTSPTVTDALANGLDKSIVYEDLLDEVMARHLRGEEQLGRLRRLVDETDFLALLNTIRFRDLSLSDAQQEQLGQARIETLRRLHSKYFPVLENLFDAAVNSSIWGIENSWTTIHGQPLYLPDDEMILMRLEVRAGLEVILHSVDRLNDLLRLGSSVLKRCEYTLRHVHEQRLSISEQQSAAISAAIQDAESVASKLRQVWPVAPAAEPALKGKRGTPRS